jgi:1-deoxy-D-xylulose-5-phosphate reductoisomerase
VARTGGTAPAVFNAANEAAVAAFLADQIAFPRIMELIEHCLDRHTVRGRATFEDLLAADAWARQEVKDRLKTHVSGHRIQGPRPAAARQQRVSR